MRYLIRLGQEEHDLHLQPHDPSRAPSVGYFTVTDTATDISHPVEVLSRSCDGQTIVLTVGGRVVNVQLPEGTPSGNIEVNGQSLPLQCDSELRRRVGAVRKRKDGGSSTIVAPLPGRIVQLHVTVGQSVDKDAAVLSIEAMKMENELRSPRAGKITAIHVSNGETVETNQILVSLDGE